MRALVLALAVLLDSLGLADAEDAWREEAIFSAAIPAGTQDAVVTSVTSALVPLGFQRDMTSPKQHPANLLKDLIAVFEAGTYAEASVFGPAGSGCFSIFVANYDKARAGLAKAAHAAIQQGLSISFKGGAKMFSDARCGMRSNPSLERP